MEETKMAEENTKPKEDKDLSQSDSDEEDDVDPELDNIITRINNNPQMKKMSLIPRSGVSAEVYGKFHKRRFRC